MTKKDNVRQMKECKKKSDHQGRDNEVNTFHDRKRVTDLRLVTAALRLRKEDAFSVMKMESGTILDGALVSLLIEDKGNITSGLETVLM